MGTLASEIREGKKVVVNQLANARRNPASSGLDRIRFNSPIGCVSNLSLPSSLNRHAAGLCMPESSPAEKALTSSSR